MKQFEMDASANRASSAKAARNGLQLSSAKGSGGHSKRLMNKYREIQSMNQENLKLLRDPPVSQRIQDNVSVPMRKYHSRKTSSANRLSNINDQSSKMEKTEFKSH